MTSVAAGREQSQPVALVIGSGGIGTQTARRLLAEGYTVCLSYHMHKPEDIDGITLYPADVTDKASVRSLLQTVMQRHGAPTTVVYAVSSPLRYQRISEVTWHDFQEHINVQQKGFFHVMQALLSSLTTLPAHARVRIIVVLTDACHGKPPSYLAPYVTAKYGLLGFIRSLSLELPASWSCNTVSPQMTDTPLLHTVPEKVIELVKYKSPSGQLLTTDEVADAIISLTQLEADALRGADIQVRGAQPSR